jgi:HAD superfamily hydrolase (TIGR01509 family)
VINAVIFDLDGVLIDSEPVWERVRKQLVADTGGHWAPDAQQRLMGMSTSEWATYLHEELAVPMPPDRIATLVIERMAASYREHLPLMPGAIEAVRRMAGRWPLALGSSSPVSLIQAVLGTDGLRGQFTVVLSTEQLSRGKPAPDIYLEVTARLGRPPRECVAVEDSTNGLRSATAAGLALVAVPHPRYPPDPAALARASLVLASLDDLTVSAINSLA